MNTKIEAVVFDMDGVIFDTECIYRKAWTEVGEQYGLSEVDLLYSKIMGATNEKIKELFLNRYGDDFDFDTYFVSVEAMRKKLFDEKGLIFKSGAPEIFKFLKDKKIPIALATSTKRSRVEGYLVNAGIDKYFDFVVTGSDITLGKPNPEIYLTACKGLKVEPENTIGIEDSFNGIRSVYNAKMKPVMIPDQVNPDKEIEKLLYKKCGSLFELMKLFED